MYISAEEYALMYGKIDPGLFQRLEFAARREIDRHTTGIDGVKKLQLHFPADEYSAEAVRNCAAEIVYFLSQIDEAEQFASMGRGYEVSENGMHGKVVSSVTSGTESVTYTDVQHRKSAADSAASDPALRKKIIRDKIRSCLEGVADANGVSLLYMGVYPYV